MKFLLKIIFLTFNVSLLAGGTPLEIEISIGAGYDEDEVNSMLDKYGYADGGKVKPEMMKMSMQSFGKEYLEYLKEKAKKRKEKKADGGRVGLFFGGEAKIDPRAAPLIKSLTETFIEDGMDPEEALEKATGMARRNFEEEFDAGEFSSNLQSGVAGLEAAFGQPLGGRRPEPMRIIPGFAEGGDVDILETYRRSKTIDKSGSTSSGTEVNVFMYLM